ncbi:hypothetical protein CYLTODRAFT_8633 [Cylindrobasidium torrendii FP15055 ss-10]|uniref:Zinc finger CHCC-type domain-containing protein n=1 Tax=Cylindrobasidium torrendii FP15055 ss-10 TaxID=1314674 RepID=A0A0D7BRN8_9AGAR|nr:hypothetical protein CYLTODRAFT_8633 [Cylindrobasidium torrendii FP15055 ss-10]
MSLFARALQRATPAVSRRLSSTYVPTRGVLPPTPADTEFPSASIAQSDALVSTEGKTAAPATASQAPNYAAPWSANQRPRPGPQSGPRFEQTEWATQPNPLSAMQLVDNEPIRIVHGRKAVCDGGNGALGHPKVFINLDKPGPRACGPRTTTIMRTRYSL